MLRLDCYRGEHSKTLLTAFCQQGSGEKQAKAKAKYGDSFGFAQDRLFDSALRAFAQDDGSARILLKGR
jgi:hypothetical protein